MTDELTPLNTGHLGLKSFHWKIGILIKSWLPTLLIRQQGSWSRKLDGRRATQNTVVPESQFSICLLV